ncbi:MAG: hypothetical protein ACN4GZ_16460 [Acidimicrobiales bacterium]
MNSTSPPHPQTERSLKLRIGWPVHSTDGPFGVTGNIVADPTTAAVTGIIVHPDNPHLQARLVPTWLLSTVDGTVVVQLDHAHLRRLQRVGSDEYRNPIRPIDFNKNFDIDASEVVIVPFVAIGDRPQLARLIDETYNGVAKVDCEIRRASRVKTSDQKFVGTVEGLVIDNDIVVAIAVTVGLPGFTKEVSVPLNAVCRVMSDCIELAISRASFNDLPRANSVGPTTGIAKRAEKGRIELESRITSTWARTRRHTQGRHHRRLQ